MLLTRKGSNSINQHPNLASRTQSYTCTERTHPQKPATTQIDRLKPRSRLTEAKCRSAHSVRLARLLHTAAAAEMLPKLKWCGRGRSSHAAWLCRCNPKLDTTQVNMWLYRLGCPHGATNLRTCTSASSCWTPRSVL